MLGRQTTRQVSPAHRRPRAVGAPIRRLGACLLAAGAPWLAAAAGAVTRVPPPEVAQLLEAPPLPTLAEGPRHRFGLLVHKHELLSEKSLAEPVVSVAGIRIDPRTHGPYAPLAYYGLTLLNLETGGQTDIGVPSDSTIGYPIWSPDGSRFAFTATVDKGIELWVGDPASGQAHELLAPSLNGTLSAPCTWMPDGRHLLCRTVVDGDADVMQTLEAKHAAQMSEPTLLSAEWQQAPLDGSVVRQLLESQLLLVDAESGESTPVGSAAAIESVDPAPNGQYLLVRRIVPPYPDMEGLSPTHRTVELWDRSGALVQVLASGQDGEHARRAIQWNPTAPATLAWVERDAGRDRVLQQAVPFAGSAPAEIFHTANRYAELDWLEDGAGALIGEYDPERRTNRYWHVATGDAERSPRLIAETSVDAPVQSFGRPLYIGNRAGKQVVEVYDGGIYLRGEAPSENGIRSYLDYLKLDSLEVVRIWQSDDKANEAVLSLLDRDGGRVLIRHETSKEPPNYFARGGRGEDFSKQLTDYEHPAPGLLNARRIPLRFRRPDGYELSANLYLPAGYDQKGPLPTIVWAYPREYGSDTHSMTLETGERFPGFDRAFKLFFLLEGYAVLDDVSMPIIGSGGTANDTFVQQVITNAKVTIEAAAATGFVDPNRVGVAGHSYGAFMVANLLVHSRLFGAGVALSGAYNRTLTPFGFQTERRTLWQAPDTYLAMSPFLYSNSLHAPLLLVHGLQDQNAGTPALQSIQFYQAIRRTGGDADILLLPHEGHSYRGRDAVLTTAATMLDFFNEHLKARKPAAAPAAPEAPQTPAPQVDPQAVPRPALRTASFSPGDGDALTLPQ